MSYPPLPKDKQYGDWFPNIPVRPVPTPPGNQTVTQSALAMQPDPGSGQRGRSAERLSLPKKIEFGAIKLWVSGAGRDSHSFDDGPSFDTKAHGMEFIEDDESLKPFCIAPGTDEKDVTIRWHFFGFQHVRSAKMELFCRGHDKPIWEHHWGNAWGKEKEPITKLPINKDLSRGRPTFFCEMPFTAIQLDKNLQVKGDDGKMVKGFPAGLLTVARSPYQLRFTVSGCSAQNTPADGDRYAYPMVAWTFFHVLIHSIKIEPGEAQWLSDQRPDIDQIFREKIIGTRKNRGDGKGIDYGWEGDVLAELKRPSVTLKEGAYNRLRLRSSIFNANLRKNKDDDKSPLYTDYERYQMLWGLGPRVPLVARPTIRRCDGGDTDENVAAVCAGMRLMWDWVDDESVPEPRWLAATKTPTLYDGKKTRDFLSDVYKRSTAIEPKGSFNCPARAGGKLGDENQPIFLEQRAAATGPGGLPFQVERCATRKWAAVSAFNDKGQTGVMFNPSRMAGDCYTVNVYPYSKELDSTARIDPSSLPHGSTGKFEVFRLVKVYHIVVGELPGVDVQALTETVKARMASQTSVEFELVLVDLFSDSAKYLEMIKAMLERMLKRPKCYTAAHMPLIHQFTILQEGLPGPQFVRIRSRAEYIALLSKMFEEGTVRAVKSEALSKEEQQIKDSKKPNTKESGEIANAYRYESLNADGGAFAYQLQDIMPLMEETEDEEANTKKVEVRPRLRYLLTKKGCPPFASGSENAKGECTNISRKLEFFENARSCWGREYKDAASTSEDTITVTFPGAAPVSVKYSKQGFSRRLKDTLDAAEVGKLRDKLRQAGKSHDESKKMEIQIEARQDSDNSRRRVANLKAALDELFDRELIVLDRRKVRDSFVGDPSNQISGCFDYANHPKTFAADWTKTIAFLEAFADAFIEREKVKEGLIVVHFTRISQIADTPDSKGVYGNAKLDWKDMMFGSNDPFYGKDNEHTGLVKLQAPDPNGANTDKTTPLKTAESVLIHEVGHALYISDHALMLPERAAAKMGDLVGADVRKHVLLDPCIMDYDKDTNQFCGLCMLRLRGWKWEMFDNKGGSQFAQISFEFGDLDNLFDAAADSWEGFAARLQVMNLFNRPLRMGRQANDHPIRKDYAHFDKCLKFSIAHAAKVLGNDILTTESDPSVTTPALAKAIGEFIVEGGAKSLDEGKQAKLRVLGGIMPLFSNSDMELRCRQTGAELFADQPEEEYGLGADRAVVETQYFEDNYALGAIPIAIKVTAPNGTELPNLVVRVSLVDPKPPAEPYKQETVNVPGGMSYCKGIAIPALHDQPDGFLKQHVVDAHPGADGDPQKDNVHYDLGGKRGLAAAGDVTNPGPKGERNILIGIDGLPLPRALDSGGQPIPHTVELMTDGNGVAEFHFCPSRIGGDTYRLKAEVLDPAIPGSGAIASKETGDLVVWRTVRVSRHVQMPGVADAGELPKPLTKYVQENGYNPADLAKPLPALDLKHLAKELAKAYMELIVEPAAQKPEDLTLLHWGVFAEKLRDLQRDYSDVLNTTTWLETKVGINDAFHVPLKRKSKLVYEAKFPAAIIPDSLYIVAGTAEKGGENMRQAVAHDFHEQRGPLQGNRGPLVELKAGDKISGRDDKTKQGAVLGVESDIAHSWVDYQTGEVQVTFKAEPQGKDWTAGCHLKFLLNLDALVTTPASSPFFFNLRTPKDYNQYARPGAVKIEEGRRGRIAKEISKKSWGLPLGMIKALHQSLGDNGQSYYPGLVIMHANYLDAYSYVCGEALQGKGTGNGVILYTGTVGDAAAIKNLMVHEAAHCLYMVHNFPTPKYIQRHDMSDDHRCVMSYDGPTVQHGGFCGKCLASLRGMPVVNGPLKDTGKPGKSTPTTTTLPPQPAQPTNPPPPRAGATYLMLSSSENANGDRGKYPTSIATDKQHLVTLTDLPGAKKQITDLCPQLDPTLDLLVLNQAHGDVGKFTSQGWTVADLKDNLVQPLLDHGVSARIIVLDFCVSASVLPAFTDLCADGGRIICNMYSLTNLVVDTDRWGIIKDNLVARNNQQIWASLEERMKALTASSTGEVNVHPLRNEYNEGQVTTLLQKAPQAKDQVSVSRYLKRIFDAIEKFENQRDFPADYQDMAKAYAALKQVHDSLNVAVADKAVLAPLPSTSATWSDDHYRQIRQNLISRMRQVATDAKFGVNATGDLSTKPLVWMENADCLGALVWGKDKEILAEAKGLPICPSVFAVYSKATMSFTLDAELQLPLAEPIGKALDLVHPLSRQDIQDVLDILSRTTLDRKSNYLQKT